MGIGGAARRRAAFVALLLLSLRILVPPGFMPDLTALRDGQIRVTLCSPDGSRQIVLDAEGRPVQDQDGRHDDRTALHCPFGLALAQDLVLPPFVALPLPRIAVADMPVATTGQGIRPPVRGPPLGARAPPAALV